MSENFKLLPIDASEVKNCKYDIAIYAVGFESRSNFVASHVKPHAAANYAIVFTDRKVHAFYRNVEWFTTAGYTMLPQSDVEFHSWIMELANNCTIVSEQPVKICIDYSSMSRLRIASIAAAFLTKKHPRKIQIDWIYSSAEYSAPSKNIIPIVKAGPVLAEFAGCPEDPEMPISVIIGLGYEYEKALGVIEYLEPASVYLLKPIRHNAKYATAIHDANVLLWPTVRSDQVIEYSINDPIGTFVILESLVFGCLRNSRVALVPFGPKILFLTSLLAAQVHNPHVGVWRVSSGEYEPPIDRISDGNTVVFRTNIAAIIS